MAVCIVEFEFFDVPVVDVMLYYCDFVQVHGDGGSLSSHASVLFMFNLRWTLEGVAAWWGLRFLRLFLRVDKFISVFFSMFPLGTCGSSESESEEDWELEVVAVSW